MKYILFFSILLWIQGCSITSEVPSKSVHLIDASIAPHTYTSKMCKDRSIMIANINANQLLKSENIYYTDANNALYTYTRDKYALSVQLQLDNLLQKVIDSSRVFQTTLTPSSEAKNYYLLETNLKEFSQTIEDEGRSTVRLEISFNLIEQYTKKIVSSKTISLKKDVDPNIDGALRGLNDLTSKTLNDLLLWLNNTCI